MAKSTNAHISAITQDPDNINAHSERGAALTRRSIEKFGARLAGIVDKNGVILDGNDRQIAYGEVDFNDIEIIDASPRRPVYLRFTDLDLADPDNPARELQLALHRSAVESFVPDVGNLFAHIDEQDLDVSDWYWPSEVDDLREEIEEDTEEQDGTVDSDTDAVTPEVAIDVPNVVWPSSNWEGIPDLDPDMQAAGMVLPCERWGQISRKSAMLGTWVFYVDDYKFSALWVDPSPVVRTGCASVVEPNFSCTPTTPIAVGLWRIYQKRWLARYWQSRGIRVFVDINVDARFRDLNYLGVPRGWKAYATRGYSNLLGDILKEYEFAVNHANGTDDMVFLVYGGGKLIQQAAIERGWIWIPEGTHSLSGGRRGEK